MRIIGGKFRGRKIKFHLSSDTRPTKDRIRESVFNIITSRIENSSVLDLFSGTGAYGLEAISRGAMEAKFVEKMRKNCALIKDNIKHLSIEKNCEVMMLDVFKSIKSLCKNNKLFDIIFCDPPYSKCISKNVLRAIDQYDILSPFGLFILEHHSKEPVPAEYGGIKLFKEKKYKDIVITIYTKK